MKTTKSQTNHNAVQALPRPRLVKAAEVEARQKAAVEAMQSRAPQAQVRPILARAPRGEAEAREMFDMLFEAA